EVKSPTGAPPAPQESRVDSHEASPPSAPAAGASKDRIVAALRRTADALRSRSVEPAEYADFEELLAAAQALRDDPGVPQHERDRLRGLARVRLSEGAALLRRSSAAGVGPGGVVVSRQLLAIGRNGSPRPPRADEVEA